MKASNLIGVAALSGVLLIGCGVNVVTVQAQPVYQQTAVSQPVDTAQQSRDRGIAALKHRLEMDQLQEEFDATLEEGMSVKIQCFEYCRDDADYLRGWGVGTGADRQTARQHALDNAKRKLHRKFVPVPGSIASLRDTARARLDSLLLDAEVVCEEYDLRFDLLGYDRHVCEIILQSPREAYQRMPGYDSLVTVTRARERQERIKANFQKFTGGLQEPAQDKSDLKPDK